MTAAGCGAMEMDRARLQQREAVMASQRPQASREPVLSVGGSPAAPAESTSAAEFARALEGRRIIYTAAFSIDVADITAAVESTRLMAERLGGYVQSLKGPEISVRVPNARFNEAAGALAALGGVTSREVRAQDVTESYADLEVRIKSLKMMLDEYARLLERAANVDDAGRRRKRQRCYRNHRHHQTLAHHAGLHCVINSALSSRYPRRRSAREPLPLSR